MSACTMCEQAPAETTWGLPVCQPCADWLNRLHGDLEREEAAEPTLAEAGRAVEQLWSVAWGSGVAKSVVERVRGGDSVRVVARDFGLGVWQVDRILRVAREAEARS